MTLDTYKKNNPLDLREKFKHLDDESFVSHAQCEMAKCYTVIDKINSSERALTKVDKVRLKNNTDSYNIWSDQVNIIWFKKALVEDLSNVKNEPQLDLILRNSDINVRIVWGFMRKPDSDGKFTYYAKIFNNEESYQNFEHDKQVIFKFNPEKDNKRLSSKVDTLATKIFSWPGIDKSVDYNYDTWKKSIWRTKSWFQFSIHDDENCISVYSRKNATIESRGDAKNICDKVVDVCKQMIKDWKNRELYKVLWDKFPEYV